MIWWRAVSASYVLLQAFEQIMWLISLFILALLGIDGAWKLPRVTPYQSTMRRLQRTACTMTEGWILRSHAQQLGAPRSKVSVCLQLVADRVYDCVAAKVRPHHQIPKKEYEHWSQGPQSPLEVDSSWLDHWNPLAHGSWQSPKWLIVGFMKDHEGIQVAQLPCVVTPSRKLIGSSKWFQGPNLQSNRNGFPRSRVIWKQPKAGPSSFKQQVAWLGLTGRGEVLWVDYHINLHTHTPESVYIVAAT